MRPGFGNADTSTAGGPPAPAAPRLTRLGASCRFVGALCGFLDNVDYARAPIKVYPQQQQHKLYYKMISTPCPPTYPTLSQPVNYLLHICRIVNINIINAS